MSGKIQHGSAKPHASAKRTGDNSVQQYEKLLHKQTLAFVKEHIKAGQSELPPSVEIDVPDGNGSAKKEKLTTAKYIATKAAEELAATNHHKTPDQGLIKWATEGSGGWQTKEEKNNAQAKGKPVEAVWMKEGIRKAQAILKTPVTVKPEQKSSKDSNENEKTSHLLNGGEFFGISTFGQGRSSHFLKSDKQALPSSPSSKSTFPGYEHPGSSNDDYVFAGFGEENGWRYLKRLGKPLHNNNPSEFKIHISVVSEDVPKAWNALKDFLIDSEIQDAKVASPELSKGHDSPVARVRGEKIVNIQVGKQIVVYDPGKLSWQDMASGVERILVKNEIRPGFQVILDKPVKGSRYQYYRQAGREGEYLPSDELYELLKGKRTLTASGAHNPLRLEDPFEDVDVSKVYEAPVIKPESSAPAATGKTQSLWERGAKLIHDPSEIRAAISEWHGTKLAKGLGVAGTALAVWGTYSSLREDGDNLATNSNKRGMGYVDLGNLSDYVDVPEFMNLRFRYGLGRETVKNIAGLGASLAGVMVGGYIGGSIGITLGGGGGAATGAVGGAPTGPGEVVTIPLGAAAGGVSGGVIGAGVGEFLGSIAGYWTGSATMDKAWDYVFGKGS